MKYLGIDYGLKKIGLAVSEGTIASPLKTLSVSGLTDTLNKILIEIEKEGIDRVVIGMPDQGKYIEKFIIELKKRGVDAISSDETLTTQNAKSMQIEMGVGRKKRKVDDIMSAALILQEYLDNNKS
jgi:putative holliday junction resolvase